jgi:hypothetical protein
MCERVKSREAFGKPLAEQGVIMEWIADSRMEIEQARLLTLKAAHMMDTVGNKEARSEIAQIKVVAPNATLRVLDRAIQAFGGAGVSGDTPLAAFWAESRILRLADGPTRSTAHRWPSSSSKRNAASASNSPTASRRTAYGRQELAPARHKVRGGDARRRGGRAPGPHRGSTPDEVGENWRTDGEVLKGRNATRQEHGLPPIGETGRRTTPEKPDRRPLWRRVLGR